MNKFIVIFFAVLLSSRFFSETIGVMPKAVDLMDIMVIPILLVLAVVRRPSSEIDQRMHSRVTLLVGLFAVISLVSSAINFERVHFGPVLLFMFGMLEGPLLFICLNKLIQDTSEMGARVARFINIMVLVEAAVVLLVNIPVFLATHNPDTVSGTFGNNCYQFSAFLVLMGGYFMGQYYVRGRVSFYGIAIQCFVVITFILLQYRTAMPAFLAAYAVLLSILYGRRFLRLGSVALMLGLIMYYGFDYLGQSNIDLKYDDLITLADDPSVLVNYGKVKSYFNTVDMYSEYPYMAIVGCGPGTYVSRANYTFSTEIAQSKGKGVSNILRAVFGDQAYISDMQQKYVMPLYQLETLFGTAQVNNPNSSVLATAAEVGLAGLLVLSLLYGLLVVHSVRFLRYAKAVRDPVLLPLAASLVTSAIYFILLSPLDNYVEVARITLPLWLLFWTVSAMVRQHRIGQIHQFYDQVEQMEHPHGSRLVTR